MRAMHLAGRCINCNNCATACPIGIPLHLLSQKIAADVKKYFGAVADLVYKYELAEWKKRTDVHLITTVDPGGETPYWKGEIGFVPTILDKVAPPSKNTIAIVCGPPIMIKYTFPVLSKLGFIPDNIFTTLENRMKCGMGKCSGAIINLVLSDYAKIQQYLKA